MTDNFGSCSSVLESPSYLSVFSMPEMVPADTMSNSENWATENSQVWSLLNTKPSNDVWRLRCNKLTKIPRVIGTNLTSSKSTSFDAYVPSLMCQAGFFPKAELNTENIFLGSKVFSMPSSRSSVTSYLSDGEMFMSMPNLRGLSELSYSGTSDCQSWSRLVNFEDERSSLESLCGSKFNFSTSSKIPSSSQISFENATLNSSCKSALSEKETSRFNTSRHVNLWSRGIACKSHASYPARFYCTNHKKLVCACCALQNIWGDHSSCCLVPKKSSVLDGNIRLALVPLIDSLIKSCLEGLTKLNITTPYALSRNGHLQLDTDLAISRSFTTDLIEFLHEINLLIESLSTCSTKQLSGLFMRTKTCLAQVSNLIDFQAPGNPSPSHCSVFGQGLAHTSVNTLSNFFILLNDSNGNLCNNVLTKPEVLVITDNIFQPVEVVPYYKHGTFKVSYLSRSWGTCSIFVKVNGESVPGTPTQLYVSPENEFSKGAQISKIVKECNTLNKPWGMCTDALGRYYIADRCNHCIKVYSNDWQFIFAFPENYSECALKKPSDVAIDKNGDVVVADKDNHRIQVFSISGIQLRCSGTETGLLFPWSVAVNSKNEYIVTHSKSSVKILSCQLVVLQEISREHSSQSFNPRGVCMGYNDEILMTEFESGRIYAVDVEGLKFRLMVEGDRGECGSSLVKRFQGLAVDDDGNILVCDSKNHCVEVYTYSGIFQARWLMPGKPVSVLPVSQNSKAFYVVLEDGKNKVIELTLSR